MQRVGVIGCGKIAQVRHLPEYHDNPNVEFAGCFDFSTERAQEIVAEYGGKVFSSVEELLADPEITAVSVCVANAAHAELSVKALNAGKHVLCEKPMANSIVDCEVMVAAAKASGKYLMIGQNQRFTKAHIAARDMIARGDIGDIISFRTTFAHAGPETWSVQGKNSWFFNKNQAAMGVMADLGVHKTDILLYLTGQRIVETTARFATIDKRDAEGSLIEVDDNAFCIYRLESGATGTMSVSWTNYGDEDNSTVIYGTKGVMRIYDDPKFPISVVKKNGEKVFYDLDRIQTNDNQTKSGIIDAFVEAIETGKDSGCSGESVLNTMRAVFASQQSAGQGRTVTIKYE